MELSNHFHRDIIELTKYVEGSGVGLYIVKRIVENNGGSITIESEEGVGTSFKIQLKEYTS